MSSLVDKIKKELGFGGVDRKNKINDTGAAAEAGSSVAEAARIRREKEKQDRAAGITTNN